MTSSSSEFLWTGEPNDYRPRPVAGFSPSRIVLAKGSNATATRRRLAEKICEVYPEAELVADFGTPHNRVKLGQADPLALHEAGKRTLVLAEHKSAVRQSTEEGNSCPNFWHFSPYGFCPYGCTYCYLAGTQGVRFSPTVKVFLNLPEILADLLSRVRLQRITLGSICSYPQALRLTERRLGRDNPISVQLDQSRMSDGRARFPQGLREEVYRHLLGTIRQHDTDIEIGLCLEDRSVFGSLAMDESLGRCNCVL